MNGTGHIAGHRREDMLGRMYSGSAPVPDSDRWFVEARLAEVIDLLLTVGYIDGFFHAREQTFIQQHVENIILLAADFGGQSGDARERFRAHYRAHFEAVYAHLHAEIRALAGEVTYQAEDSFVPTRLEVRAIAIFRSFTAEQQEGAIELLRALIQADGQVSASERHLAEELLRHLAVPPAPPAEVTAPGTRPIVVADPVWNPLSATSHPLLDGLEYAYSPHPDELKAQIAFDHGLAVRAMAEWKRMRARGRGRLARLMHPDQVELGADFLDGHVHIMRPARPIELVVLGDLHGCYGCLKAALLQSRFIERVWAHQWDPFRTPDVKLVLLGDYIDRGRFSFDGVLRTVLTLFLSMPDNVVVLRGNHEYFVSDGHRVYSGVHPAEALASLGPHVPFEVLEGYRSLFEAMPTALVVGRTLFVHGGVPRDDLIENRVTGLASLDDPEVRFHMLWSDPSPTDHVPVELQRQSARFSFGRQQFRSFMQRIGCHTLIRGHEQIDAGFDVVYDLGDQLLLNLFSAGGFDNVDLPIGAQYRSVRPMAMTMHVRPDGIHAIPWQIDYQPFNYPPHNGFHRELPLLEFRYS